MIGLFTYFTRFSQSTNVTSARGIRDVIIAFSSRATILHPTNTCQDRVTTWWLSRSRRGREFSNECFHYFREETCSATSKVDLCSCFTVHAAVYIEQVSKQLTFTAPFYTYVCCNSRAIEVLLKLTPLPHWHFNTEEIKFRFFFRAVLFDKPVSKRRHLRQRRALVGVSVCVWLRRRHVWKW